MDIIGHGARQRRRVIAAVVTALVLAALAGQTCRAADQQQNDTLRIGEARSLPDGTQVTLAGKAVTRTLGDRYYVAEPDRSAGIAVLLPRSYAPGTLVNIQGTLASVSGETVISSASDSVEGEAPPVAPLGISNRDAARKIAGAFGNMPVVYVSTADDITVID